MADEVKEIRDMEIRFELLELSLKAYDEKQVDIMRHQTEIRTDLTHAYELLESIKVRLARIEDLPHDQ